jgi:protein-S-isoprenylcysteine O-methyltransferase Ste14
LASLSFVALFIVSALDHRFGWSAVPSYVVAAGDVLVAAGLIAVFFVFKENTYASAIIEVGEEQKLISTGLYGVVRHPMYAGAMVMLAGVPISLGSWWGLIMVVPMASVIIVRLLEEEKFLIINLSGYPEYQKKVRYRLLPHIW